MASREVDAEGVAIPAGHCFACGAHWSPVDAVLASEPTSDTPPPIPLRLCTPEELNRVCRELAHDDTFGVWARRSLLMSREHLEAWGVRGDLFGQTVFLWRTVGGALSSCKVVPYGEDGKRLKKGLKFNAQYASELDQAWGFVDNTGTWRATTTERGFWQFLYGAHLLHDDGRPVVVVEAEKTAVICSHFWPDVDWLAAGGASSGITKAKVDQLRRRDVDGVVLPQLVERLKSRPIYVAYDNDTAGKQGQFRAVMALEYLMGYVPGNTYVSAYDYAGISRYVELRNGDDLADVLIACGESWQDVDMAFRKAVKMVSAPVGVLRGGAREEAPETRISIDSRAFGSTWNGPSEFSLARRGEMIGIVAKPGSGKTSLVSAIMASAFARDASTTMGFRTNARKVVVFDTELSAYGAQAHASSALKRAGMDPEADLPASVEWVPVGHMVRMGEAASVSEVFWNLLGELDPDVVIIDNLRDLAPSREAAYTDANAADKLLEAMMKDARESGRTYVATIHPNAGGVKPAGHLGSAFVQKADSILGIVVRDGDDVGDVTYRLTPNPRLHPEGKVRWGSSSWSIDYQWSNEHGYFMPVAFGQGSFAVREEDFQAIMPGFISNEKDLIETIKKHFGVGAGKARAILQDCVHAGLLRRERSGRTTSYSRT